MQFFGLSDSEKPARNLKEVFIGLDTSGAMVAIGHLGKTAASAAAMAAAPSNRLREDCIWPVQRSVKVSLLPLAIV